MTELTVNMLINNLHMYWVQSVTVLSERWDIINLYTKTISAFTEAGQAMTHFLYSAPILEFTKHFLPYGSVDIIHARTCNSCLRSHLSWLSEQLSQSLTRVHLRFPAAFADLNATHHTLWKHIKNQNKKQGSFSSQKSSATLFAMMDYITGFTGMSLMDIWWSSKWMGTVESNVISHHVLKSCYVLY